MNFFNYKNIQYINILESDTLTSLLNSNWRKWKNHITYPIIPINYSYFLIKLLNINPNFTEVLVYINKFRDYSLMNHIKFLYLSFGILLWCKVQNILQLCLCAYSYINIVWYKFIFFNKFHSGINVSLHIIGNQVLFCCIYLSMKIIWTNISWSIMSISNNNKKIVRS